MADMLSEDDARRIAEDNLDNVLEILPKDIFREGFRQYTGKVRENITFPDGKSRVIVTTDNVSAFDSRVGVVPFKGQVLDAITNWWFERTEGIAPNHVLGNPAGMITVAQECRPIPVEMVVRGYNTGSSSTSVYRAFERGCRVFSGQVISNNVGRDQLLVQPIVTPSTKAGCGEHDETVSFDYILEHRLMPGPSRIQQEFLLSHIHDRSLALFRKGQELSSRMGLVFVDTKYEWGITFEGEVVLMDEIHTPDSSRYWEADDLVERMQRGESPRSLSKQFARDALIADGYVPGSMMGVPKLRPEAVVECAVRYMMLCQRITGRCFKPDTRDVKDRIYSPLEKLGVMRR